MVPHFEMDVGAGGHAGAPCPGYEISLNDRLAYFYNKGRIMAVKRREPAPMVNNNSIPISGYPSAVDHDAVSNRCTASRWNGNTIPEELFA